jgi:small subunit ribosomal protein S21
LNRKISYDAATNGFLPSNYRYSATFLPKIELMLRLNASGNVIYGTNFFGSIIIIPTFAALKNSKRYSFMLIIDSKDCENIDKALKKYKKKFEKAKVLMQLRDRQSFTKPSVKRRGEVLKAIYKQQIASGKIEL